MCEEEGIWLCSCGHVVEFSEYCDNCGENYYTIQEEKYNKYIENKQKRHNAIKDDYYIDNDIFHAND